MKTVRFSKVVEKAGKPEVYLTLTEPAKDRALQSAVKAQRVMTVSQESVGTKADRGEVGFKAGPGRQYLVFPKSLKPFAGHGVVGIKYNLLDGHETPKNERAARTRKPKPPSSKRAPKARPVKAEPTSRKVVAFKAKADEEDADEEVAELKKQVRRAMSVLEEGKAVAAFNLLKRIVGG